MIRKFFIAALVVAAFGCARPAEPPRVATAPHRQVAEPRELRPVQMQPLVEQPRGVALHGPEKTYLEQVDNSGWSGRSPAPPPEAVGGGPPEYEDSADEQEQTNPK